MSFLRNKHFSVAGSRAYQQHVATAAEQESDRAKVAKRAPKPYSLIPPKTSIRSFAADKFMQPKKNVYDQHGNLLPRRRNSGLELADIDSDSRTGMAWENFSNSVCKPILADILRESREVHDAVEAKLRNRDAVVSRPYSARDRREANALVRCVGRENLSACDGDFFFFFFLSQNNTHGISIARSLHEIPHANRGPTPFT